MGSLIMAAAAGVIVVCSVAICSVALRQYTTRGLGVAGLFCVCAVVVESIIGTLLVEFAYSRNLLGNVVRPTTQEIFAMLLLLFGIPSVVGVTRTLYGARRGESPSNAPSLNGAMFALLCGVFLLMVVVKYVPNPVARMLEQEREHDRLHGRLEDR